MKILHIALFIMVTSASLQITNDMGVFTAQMPTRGLDSAEGHVSNLTAVSTSTELTSDFAGILMITKALGFMFNMLKSAIAIGFLLDEYGVPIEIIAPVQGIIWAVYAIGAFQMITGRGTKYYD